MTFSDRILRGKGLGHGVVRQPRIIFPWLPPMALRLLESNNKLNLISHKKVTS